MAWGRQTRASRLRHTASGGRALAVAAPVATEPHGDVVPLDEVARLGHHARELGCLGSLATRIEPQLLRALRLELLPEAPAAAEAELWLSGVVDARAATGIVLAPLHRQALQRQLARDRSRLERAHAVLRALHHDAPPALRLEEELTYHWLREDVGAAREIVRSLVATLVAPGRGGVWKWASQALLRLPEGLMALEETQMLALGTALRGGEPHPLQDLAESSGRGWDWLAPEAREIEIGVNLRSGAVEFVPRAVAAAHRIRVPDTNPVLIEIAGNGSTDRVEHVRLTPSLRTLCEFTGDALEIRVAGAGTWRLRAAKIAERAPSKFVARSRPPRVQIEYDVDLYGAIKQVSLPFVVGVLSDLSGAEALPLPPLSERTFVEYTADNIDDRLRATRPRLSFTVANTLSGEGLLAVSLEFEALGDFSPSAVARRIPPLEQLVDARDYISSLARRVEGRAAEGLIEGLLADAELRHTMSPAMVRQALQAGFATDEAGVAALDRSAQALHTALESVRSRRAESIGRLPRLLAAVDRALSAQLDLILHHEEFQRLEGAWRGLHFLVSNTETDSMLKIRVLNVSKRELLSTLQRFAGSAWELSPLFQKIYTDEYTQLGGEPYGCLVGDYYYDHSPPDVLFLAAMARVCATAHCPFIAGASPALVQLEGWQALSLASDRASVFTTSEYAAWHELRQSDDARYLALAMPRFLARTPYAAEDEEFGFQEDVGQGFTAKKHTWANAAFAMAANICHAFKVYGWCARIRGIESGGVVEGLPLGSFPADDGSVDVACPTEIALSERTEGELAELGLLPLAHLKGSHSAVFLSAASLHSPRRDEDLDGAGNGQLAARLPYLLVGCRLVHYLACVARDSLSDVWESDALQARLQTWINGYVSGYPGSSSALAQAKKPLAAADVLVASNEEGYRAQLYIQPHYQLEGLSRSLRFSFRLPFSPSPDNSTSDGETVA
jgi:type VI secretion system protein ImpC